MSTFVLLLVLWTTFGAMAFLEFRRRSPALLFALALVFAAGLPTSVYLFTSRFERAVLVEAILYIALFNALYLGARLLLPGARVLTDDAQLEGPIPSAEKRFLSMIALIFILPFAIGLAEAGFSLQFLAASSWREGISIPYMLMLYGAHASFGIVLGLVVLRRYLLAGLALAAVATLVIVDRRRAMAIAAVAPLLLYLIFWSLRGRVKPLRIALTIGAGFVALVSFFLVQQIRYLGPLVAAATADPEIVLGAALRRIGDVQGDLSLVDYFMWLLINGHYVDGYGEMITVQRMLLFWLPGDLKPPEFTHSIATAIRGGEQGASIHPTIYGLSWAEAQWFGLLYAPFLAGSFRVLDRVIKRFGGRIAWAVLLGPYTVFAVLTARGTVYNAWVIMLLTTLFLLCLLRFARFRPSGRPFRPLPEPHPPHPSDG